MFFSGFCLHREESLFSVWRVDNPYTVSGFSLGAIRAVEFVAQSSQRIELLQLFSPAYFCDKDERFKRLQKREYARDRENYGKIFLRNIASPSTYDMTPFVTEGSEEELALLLEYGWDKEVLQKIVDRGTRIEVFLGGRDVIIDPMATMEFFIPFGRVEVYKTYGHILKGEE